MTCFIPCVDNVDLLKGAVASLYNQVDGFCIIDNTRDDIVIDDPDNKVLDIVSPTPLSYEQSLNVAISYCSENPYCLWGHNDIVVQPGAVDALMHKWNEVKDTKWGVIYSSYDSLCLFNPSFFYNEDIWGDPWLFSGYYGDNHRYRLMDLRGYGRHSCPEAEKLVAHLGSKTLANPLYRKRNEFSFDAYGQIYSRIWGGMPGRETVTDPTCHGLYPLRGAI